MPRNQTTAVAVGIGAAAAAALAIYVYWFFYKKGKSGHQQPPFSSDELRRARLEYLERNTILVSRRQSGSTDVLDQPRDLTLSSPGSEEQSMVPGNDASISDASHDDTGVSLRCSLSLSTSESRPGSSAYSRLSSQIGRSPTSPARAYFSKRRDSVVATQNTINSFHSRYIGSTHPPIGDPSFDDKSGAPVINPIKTLDDVLRWCPGFDEFAIAWRLLRHRHIATSLNAGGKRAQLVACHDMMGGYLDDRLCQGSRDGEPAFYLPYWDMIEKFIYFSHNLVTLPPPTWTDAAHLHGVPVLGTFITEWDAGAAVCARFLSSVENAHKLAEKLADMAQYYRFDGWLVNIENVLKKEQVAVMCEFLQHLTRKIEHSVGSHGCVLWYDSVTKDGELAWQNALNDKNRMFYESCDGIFVNYTWTEKSLELSRATAATDRDSLDRVFVGIDVFGRGCPGGGGYNSIEALTTISEHGLSAALFAFGWVWETKDEESFAARNEKFWKLLSPKAVHFCPSSLPLCSCFSLGVGKDFFINGKRVFSGTWNYLSVQDYQPNALQVCSGKFLELDPVYFDSSDAYNASQCLGISGKATLQKAAGGEQLPTSDCACARLFSTSINVSHPIIVSFTHIAQGTIDVALSLFVTLPDGRGLQLVLPAVGSTHGEEASQGKGLDSLDTKLKERYGICRSRSLGNVDTWLTASFLQDSDTTDALASRSSSAERVPFPSAESSSSSLSSSLNLSIQPLDSSSEGLSPNPYPMASSEAATEPSVQPSIEGFAPLSGKDQALVDALATGTSVSDRDSTHKRGIITKWKTSHFLIAGQHVRSYSIKDIAILCRPSVGGTSNSSSVDPDNDDDGGRFHVKLGEIRLAEARWLRSEFLEPVFALRCGGVQWQAYPSVVLESPPPLLGAHLSVKGCTATGLDLTLLWDHPAPLSVEYFEIYVHGLEDHRACMQSPSLVKYTSLPDPKSFVSSPSLPHVEEEDDNEDEDAIASDGASTPAAAAQAKTTSDQLSAGDAALIRSALRPESFAVGTSTPKGAPGRPEYLGRAYGLSYHVSRLPLVCVTASPSPESVRKAASTGTLAGSEYSMGTHSSKRSTPRTSPAAKRHTSQSTPVTPMAAPVRYPQQHIWFTVQPVSRARLRLPVDQCPRVCFSWST